MRALWLVVAGCGRIGFDPTQHSDGSAPLDVQMADALLAWYPMDEITATGITDATGRGHAALCPTAINGTDCPSAVPGRIGNALSLDAMNLLEVASTPDLTTTRGFTVAVWVQIDAAPLSRACVTTKGLGAGVYNSWALCIEPSQQVFFYSVTGMTVDNLFSTATVGTGAWHHVAIRWDGATKTIAIDAVDAGSDTAPIDFDGQSVWIGTDVDSGASVSGYTGLADDLRIYNRALTPGELAMLAQ